MEQGRIKMQSVNSEGYAAGPLTGLWQRISRASFCLMKSLADAASCLRGKARPDAQLVEEHLRHMSGLIDSVATGIISLDGMGRIRVFNAAAERLFVISGARVVGRPFADAGRLLGIEDRGLRGLWDRLSDAVWAAGAALDLEYDLLMRTGHRKVISYSVYPLGRTAWSVDRGVVIVFEDITRKKEMEEQISEGRKRLQTVFDGITDGIQVVGSDFRITAVNKSMTALVGRSIKLGERCYHACMHKTAICEDCPADETFRTGMHASITKALPLTASKKGPPERERIAEINTFPLMDRANRVVQVVEYIKDVTEKMDLAERLEHSRRLAELGEMAARIAHEVRNPLNAITGAAHYLSTEYAADHTLLKFTDLIKRQSIRLSQVASDILDAAKPMRLNRTSVNVNAVVGQSLGSLCEMLDSQKIKVENSFGRDLPSIQADELQIEQALQNIIKNAIEAMQGGGVLRISTGMSEGGEWIEIGIQDTGNGVPEEDRERIFESFFTTKARGTGLGLTIVHGVLKNHGGDIAVEQPETGGTKVVVRLPSGNGWRGAAKTPGRGSQVELTAGSGTRSKAGSRD